MSRRLFGFVLALSLLLALTGCGGDDSAKPQASTSSTSSATSSPTSAAMPAGTGPIEPGTYRIPKSAWSDVDFTVTFPEGWTAQYGHTYHKHTDTDDELTFYSVVVDGIYADPCVNEGGALIEVGPTVDDLATALRRQPGPTASRPVETTFGGYPATRIDLSVPEGYDLEPCNVPGIGLQIWYSQPADKYFVLLGVNTDSVYIVDVDGQRQVFLIQHSSSSSDEELGELQEVLDTIHIET